MLKHADTVKNLQFRAVDAIRDLLLDMPGVEVESVEYERKLGSHDTMDGLIAFTHRGSTAHRFARTRAWSTYHRRCNQTL